MSAVHALIQLEGGLDDPPADDQRAASDGLRGSVVVLTLACFEGFLQSLFEEQLDRILRCGVALRHFEDTLQISAVYNSLDLAHRGEVGQQLKKVERLPSAIAVARAVGAGGFSPKALSATRSNPNAETVAGLFTAIGRKDPWKVVQGTFTSKWSDSVTQTFCKDKLDELVRSRNQVAHTAVSTHIVRSYLDETARFIDVLSESVLETLDAHVEGCIRVARAKQDTAEASNEGLDDF